MEEQPAEGINTGAETVTIDDIVRELNEASEEDNTADEALLAICDAAIRNPNFGVRDLRIILSALSLDDYWREAQALSQAEPEG